MKKNKIYAVDILKKDKDFPFDVFSKIYAGEKGLKKMFASLNNVLNQLDDNELLRLIYNFNEKITRIKLVKKGKVIKYLYQKCTNKGCSTNRKKTLIENFCFSWKTEKEASERCFLYKHYKNRGGI